MFFKTWGDEDAPFLDTPFHVAHASNDDGGFVVLGGQHPKSVCHAIAAKSANLDIVQPKPQCIAACLCVKGGFCAPVASKRLECWFSLGCQSSGRKCHQGGNQQLHASNILGLGRIIDKTGEKVVDRHRPESGKFVS